MHRISYDSSVTLFILLRSEKGSSGSDSAPPALSGPETQDVAVFPAEDDARCCVPPLPRDPARSSRKQCFAYFLTVVHFRKLRNNIKVGSGRNGHPVI